jgi:hypothetical protein
MNENNEFNNDNIDYKKLFINSSVPIASAIASYARIYINKYKLEYEKDLIYSDTDSLVLSKEINKKYVGTEIGKMKLEYQIKEGYFINPKTYYLLTNDNKEIFKGKGISSAFSNIKLLNKEDYITLYKNNSIIKQRNLLKRNYLNGEIKILKSFITINTDILKRNKVIINNEWVDTTPIFMKENI